MIRPAVATAALVLALALARAIAQPAAPAPQPATGFDHLVHRAKVEASGRAVPACADCHPLTSAGTLAGRPGHAACFPCHGPAPVRGVAAPAPPPALCVVCHPPAGLATRTPALASPVYGPDHEHGLALDHARHTSPCGDCHATGAPAKAPRAHARCATCHLAGTPSMSSCEACHPPAIGPGTRPHLIEHPLSVARAFSHERHAGRPAAPACAACHQAIATTHERELPTPTAADCSAGGCHDGAAAFAITASCTRCHSRPPGAAPAAPAPQARFVHRSHEALTAMAACDRCHGLDARGQPTVPTHAACSDGACHQRDFGSATPTTCGACHLATEPWRPLLPDQRPPDEVELAVTLSHRLHPGPCEGCHQRSRGPASLDRSAARHPLRPPRGHGACTAAGCHAADRGPAPRLTACAGCHQPGVVDERRRRRSLALWSVAATFDHERHAIHPRDRSPLACTACHDTPAADGAMTSPAKARCAPCHDGAIAFKMTGHGCARCHATEASP